VSGLPALDGNVVGTSRIAVTAVRGFANAVHRNRAKRMARESMRRLRGSLVAGHDIIVMLRPQLLDCSAAQVSGNLREALRSASLLARSSR
jgi:ribonuclease P protein component